ncbi:AAA family ATPase [Paenibacillus polymyxa]|uniref:AAA family ATPase n=1 Tax=Paenibacillus polymyxa TaxID=1406 RepID=UPI00298BF0A3|nr:AAA family ATPase [Paenibacillus polymyxa]
MGSNKIYYGPPGTGKTFMLQHLIEEYTDYSVDDQIITNAYTRNSHKDWLLIALIIMQNNEPMTGQEILQKIRSMTFGNRYNKIPSDILELHSIKDSILGNARALPRIFKEKDSRWYIDRMRILEYDNNFMINYLSNDYIEKRYDFVTFHQSFVYEDFVEGIRPYFDSATSSLGYEVQDGVFRKICKKAQNNPHKKFALFIDEINRGNVSEIFGELITLIETDKRLGEYCEITSILPYSKAEFGVPSNLDIIGTMNSADRSIAMIDLALRRRFEFINMTCDYRALEETISETGLDVHDIDGIDVISLLRSINLRIEFLLDANHIIGQAYFIKVKSFQDIKNVLRKKIVPLLEEYFFDDLQKIQLVLNDLDDNMELKSNAIYTHSELTTENLFDSIGDYGYESKRSYSINQAFDRGSVQKIYSGMNI